MSAQLKVVCLLVWCLPTCIMSTCLRFVWGLCDVGLLVWLLSACLYYVFISVLWLLGWWRLSNLYDVCLPVLYLGSCTYNICLSLPVWYLTPCIMYGFFIFDAWLSVQCLGTWMMSAYLYYVCLLVWCLSTCMMSAYLRYICLLVLCLLNCIKTAWLYDVCLSLLYLATCTHTYDVWLPVDTMSCYH